MKSITFTIYDSKARAYIEPWEAQTVAVGLRRWMENCMLETCMFHKHPGDFTLHEKESFDSDTGIHTKYTNPIDHGTAQQMINGCNAQREYNERMEEHQKEAEAHEREPKHFPTTSPELQENFQRKPPYPPRLKNVKDSK